MKNRSNSKHHNGNTYMQCSISDSHLSMLLRLYSILNFCFILILLYILNFYHQHRFVFNLVNIIHVVIIRNVL